VKVARYRRLISNMSVSPKKKKKKTLVIESYEESYIYDLRTLISPM